MDFSVWLFGAAVVTGVITLWDVLWGRKGREAKGRQHEPVLVAYGKAFFPVILIVFCLRSFLVEPFRIPSGSMLPTLNIGDFILVNKFDYGLRLPILNKKLVELDSPQRGEVMVFRFPQDPSVHFIKRIVGLPGDEILIQNKRLIINGEPVPLIPDGRYTYEEKSKNGKETDRFLETLGEHDHDVVMDLSSRAVNQRIVVPEGNYFLMGDNRDHSNDSRYWGFVPDENVVGRAFFIWFSWDSLNGGGVNWSRIGQSIR